MSNWKQYYFRRHIGYCPNALCRLTHIPRRLYRWATDGLYEARHFFTAMDSSRAGDRLLTAAGRIGIYIFVGLLGYTATSIAYAIWDNGANWAETFVHWVPGALDWCLRYIGVPIVGLVATICVIYFYIWRMHIRPVVKPGRDNRWWTWGALGTNILLFGASWAIYESSYLEIEEFTFFACAMGVGFLLVLVGAFFGRCDLVVKRFAERIAAEAIAEYRCPHCPVHESKIRKLEWPEWFTGHVAFGDQGKLDRFLAWWVSLMEESFRKEDRLRASLASLEETDENYERLVHKVEVAARQSTSRKTVFEEVVKHAQKCGLMASPKWQAYSKKKPAAIRI